MYVWSAESGEGSVLRRQAVVGRSPKTLSTPRRVTTRFAGRRTDGVSGSEVGWSWDNSASNQCLYTQKQFSFPSVSAAAVTREDNAAESCGRAYDDEKPELLCPDYASLGHTSFAIDDWKSRAGKDVCGE